MADITREELLRLVRVEVARMANVILTAQAGVTDSEVEDISNMYRDSGTLTQRPSAKPYGFASRAPQGTRSVVGRVGDHPQARVTLGHLDPSRPSDIQEGEAAAYSQGGMQMRVANGDATMGKTSDGTSGGFAGQSSIKVSEVDGMVVLFHKSGAAYVMDKDGSISVVSKDGNMLFLNAKDGECSLVQKDGSMIAMGSKGVVISDKTGKQTISLDNNNTAQVVADTNVVVSAPSVTIAGGTINLGAVAPFSVGIAENIQIYLDTYIWPVIVGLAPGTPTSSSFTGTPLGLGSIYAKLRGNV